MTDWDKNENPDYILGIKIDKEYDKDGKLISQDLYYKDINHYDIEIRNKAEQFSKEIDFHIEKTLAVYRKAFDKYLAKRGLTNWMGFLVRKDLEKKDTLENAKRDYFENQRKEINEIILKIKEKK